MKREEVYLNNIRKGMKLLDKHGPEDWRDQINLEHLDISDVHCCVLGQLYGRYSSGVEELGVEDTNQYGFSTDLSYRSLTKYWQQQLAESA